MQVGRATTDYILSEIVFTTVSHQSTAGVVGQNNVAWAKALRSKQKHQREGDYLMLTMSMASEKRMLCQQPP